VGKEKGAVGRDAHFQVTGTFELYCVLNPFVNRAAGLGIAERLLRTLKRDENRLFLTTASTF
jgi:hypothetical protein